MGVGAPFRLCDPVRSQLPFSEKPCSSPLNWMLSLKYNPPPKKQQKPNSRDACLRALCCVLCWLSPLLLNCSVCIHTECVWASSSHSQERGPPFLGSEEPALPAGSQQHLSAEVASRRVRRRLWPGRGFSQTAPQREEVACQPAPF